MHGARTDAAEFAGINSREELARMETQIRDEINRHLMAAGVTLVDPATAYIGPEVEIGTRYHDRAQRADPRRAAGSVRAC